MKTKIRLILFSILIATNAFGQREKEYKNTVIEIRQLLQDTSNIESNLDLIKKQIDRIQLLERYYSNQLNFNKKGMPEIKEESQKQIEKYIFLKSESYSKQYQAQYLQIYQLSYCQ